MAQWARDDERIVRILRILAGHSDGITAAELVTLVPDERRTRLHALQKIGQSLRYNTEIGRVERLGLRPTGKYHNVPSMAYGITPEGLLWLKRHLAAAAALELRTAEAERERERARQARIRLQELCADARRRTDGRRTPVQVRKAVARELRDQGCPLQQIADVFGITREQVRIDLGHLTPTLRSKRKRSATRT